MNDTTKKILNIGSKVLSIMLITFTVFMMIFTLFSVFTLDKNERSLFGVRFYIVQTDSMSKSENNKDMDVHFNAGDIILAKKPKGAEDIAKLEAGDIISFVSSDPDSWGQTITHMIHEVKRDKQGRVTEIITFGTNTGAIDPTPVDPNFVLGTYKGKIPLLGRFFAFVKSVPGYICCILVPFLLIIVYNLINVIKLFRQYKKEQSAVIQAEKDQIEKDREENQRMMAELLALKAQLEGKDVSVAATSETAAATEPTVQNTSAPEVVAPTQAAVETPAETEENVTSKEAEA